jgi:hypothetical protein
MSRARAPLRLLHPGREDAPLELPKNLQGWYDGHTTTITLPSGRQYRSPAFTLIDLNPDAFRGRALEFTNADGMKQYINDYWYGTTWHEHGHRHALHL